MADHPGVRRRRILTRPEDIKETKNRWLEAMLATSVVSAVFICGNVFAVVRRSTEYNICLVLAFAGTVLGCWISDRMGFGLVGVAVAKLLITVIAAAAIALRAYAQLAREHRAD